MSEWWEYVNHPGASPMADLRRRNGRAEPWNVRLWGIGNESWGCGGNMRPEYYADLYKRFTSFLPAYGPVRAFRIATGPGDVDSSAAGEIRRRPRVALATPCRARRRCLNGSDTQREK